MTSRTSHPVAVSELQHCVTCLGGSNAHAEGLAPQIGSSKEGIAEAICCIANCMSYDVFITVCIHVKEHGMMGLAYLLSRKSVDGTCLRCTGIRLKQMTEP